jgi:hypothetical protein
LTHAEYDSHSETNVFVVVVGVFEHVAIGMIIRVLVIKYLKMGFSLKLLITKSLLNFNKK